jgi:hypothetical protein
METGMGFMRGEYQMGFLFVLKIQFYVKITKIDQHFDGRFKYNDQPLINSSLPFIKLRFKANCLNQLEEKIAKNK